MTKIITSYVALLITAIVFLPQQVNAQAPEKMSYQAVVRDGSNDLVTEAQVGMKISILQGTASGTAVYVETQTPTSNANGLVSLEIGTGVTISGDFTTIVWANGPYFIKTETDPTGGTNYTITGTSQLLSVPYALYAQTSGSSIPGPQGPQGIQGEQGPIGPRGEQGIQGIPGNDGVDGLNGTDGADGQDGVGIASTVDNNDGTFTINYTDGSSFTTADLRGPQGEQGIQGPPGNDGTNGTNGQDGVGIASTVDNNDGTFTINYTDGSSFTTADLTGPQGEQGPVGPTGLSGPQGVQGPPGNDGSDGLNGQDGADGLSAYDVWLSLGNTGTEQDFIDSLTGPSGNGIESTTDNGDGTFTFDYTDGTSFTTSDLTGPQGTPSTGSQAVITDSSNIDNLSLDNGTIVYNSSDGAVYLYTTYGASTVGNMFTDASTTYSPQTGNNFILSFKVSQEIRLGTINKGIPESSSAYIDFFEDSDNDIYNGIGQRILNSGTTYASYSYVGYNSILSPNYTYNILFSSFNKNLREAPTSSLVFDSSIFSNVVFYKTTSTSSSVITDVPSALQISNTYPFGANVVYLIIDGSPSLIRIN